MRSRRRAYLFVPLVILFCAVTAGIFGGAAVSAANPTEEAARDQSVKSFTRIYAAVEQNFADPVQPDKAIFDGAIPGMLHTLDPHSNFFDPKEYAKLQEDQSGRYYGIGMMVGPRNNRTIVKYPFSGSPAFKAGLRPGDAILEVNDKKTDTLSMSEVADLLKGPRGTKVQVLVQREGNDKPITFNIVRDEIPRSSVPYALFLKNGIAYVTVNAFNQNTGKELDDKLKKLGEKDIKGLVLDLRENPGGLENEGVDVAGHFLKKADVVVDNRGRMQGSSKVYKTSYEGTGKDYPVVVLVNRRTASAAEIVSGALQDHDRAWILGETTFGKGLVQTVFPMSDNTGLALTTAHFYTPSGRLIQRDYSNISFLDYYTHSNLDQKNAADVKMTDGGRTVYGGGGITPDEHFACTPLDYPTSPYCSTADKWNKFQTEVYRKSGFFNFAVSYFGPRADPSLPKGWEPDDRVIEQFHDFMLKNKFDFTEADFTANRTWVKQELKREMYITAFSYEDSQRVAIEQDPAVQKAIESMPNAKKLLDNAKKLLVERISQQQSQVAAR
ncbi:MAG TPA: S41 family peptidase [Bryobacteraceae bacterium]|jgi:carboxyl-terminal processing protease